MEDVLIVINIDHIVDGSDENIKNAKPGCDIEENQHTTIRIIELLINSLIAELQGTSTQLRGECFQATIDYLTYTGISDEMAFTIVNTLDTELMSTIFSTIPFIENEQLIKIKDYKIFCRKDLAIHAKINKKHFGNTNQQLTTSVGNGFNSPTTTACV